MIIAIITTGCEDSSNSTSELGFDEFISKVEELKNKYDTDELNLDICLQGKITSIDKTKCEDINIEYSKLFKRWRGVTPEEFDTMLSDRTCTHGYPNCNEFTEKQIETKKNEYWKNHPDGKDIVLCVYPNCSDSGTFSYMSGDLENP